MEESGHHETRSPHKQNTISSSPLLEQPSYNLRLFDDTRCKVDNKFIS